MRVFDALDYQLVNLTAKLFLSIFAHTLPEETSLRVIDLFLLEGLQSNKIIFDVTLGYLKIIERKVAWC